MLEKLGQHYIKLDPRTPLTKASSVRPLLFFWPVGEPGRLGR